MQFEWEIFNSYFSDYELDNEIRNIALEEADYYFKGEKTREQVGLVIESRVMTKIWEQEQP